jgi:HAD superfamily hydrolase (TIGR01509 family)
VSPDVIPRGAIFDMDGVLVDSGAHHRAAWSALLAELGAPVSSPEFWRLTIGRPAHEAVGLLLGRDLDHEEAMELARRKRDFYRRLAGRGAVAVPGIPAFVAAVRGSGTPCAVATSASRRDARDVLQSLGLTRHFGAVVTAEDVTRGKPDPEVYVRAAAGLGVAPGDCLVFEDAVVGVQAARRAGMRVIGVTTAHTGPELDAAGAERTIADFAGLAWPM